MSTRENMLGPGAETGAATAPESATQRRQGSALLRAMYVTAGTALVAIGVIGIWVPGLPTTPFLLLAAWCYARSSERLYNWLLAHPQLGPPVQTFIRERAVSLRVKIFSIVFTWAMMGGLAWMHLHRPWLAALHLSLAVIQTSVMLVLKTARPARGRD